LTRQTPITIGLLWHSVTSDNLGVGALTASQISIVEEIARTIDVPIRFIVLGWQDPRPGYVTAPNVSRFDMRMKDVLNPRGLYAQVRHCDLVLDIGAGDSFADIYGPGRIWRMLLGKFIVHAARSPMILSPQTFGPFARGWARHGALASIRRCRAVFTRDNLSTRFLREIGYTGDIGEATDVALRLPYDAPDSQVSGSVRIGVNVSGLLMNGGYTRQNMFGLKTDYPALMRAILARFEAMPGTEVHLIGHVISEDQPVEDDYRASQALASEFPSVLLAPKFASPSEAKSYIAGMDFFLGARMHACIAAFSSGVPVIPMAYSRKFAGLFGALGYDYTVDCTLEDADAILAKVFEGFGRRADLRDRMKEALDLGLSRLGVYETALRDTLQALARA
jgi:colanic acid/amylovoran biosynthesis protein